MVSATQINNLNVKAIIYIDRTISPSKSKLSMTPITSLEVEDVVAYLSLNLRQFDF